MPRSEIGTLPAPKLFSFQNAPMCLFKRLQVSVKWAKRTIFQPFSVAEKGFSVNEKVFSHSEKGFSINEKVFSAFEKGFSMIEKGLSVTDKGFSVTDFGLSKRHSAPF